MNYYNELAGMVLYVVTNTANGMKYVGITSRQLHRRWQEHINDAIAGRGWALHDAIRAFGHESFNVEKVASSDSWDDICEQERLMIAELGSLVPGGYNITHGGEGVPGRVMSDETKAKISAAHKGKVLCLEHRLKLAAAKIGKKLKPRSQEHSSRISDGLRKAWARRKAS